MSWLRRILCSVAVLILLALAVAGHYYYKGFYKPLHHRNPDFLPTADQQESRYLREKIADQKPYLKNHGFNTRLCMLVDMRLPSGKNRFFVYDLDKDTIKLAGLVAHGAGRSDFSETPGFSNINGSGYTSLGKYRIGGHYQGKFGLAYKLYGLDTSNDQAFNRNIVLHSWTGVPAGETYPYPICNSRGCPMVSPAFLKKLQPLIDATGKPILLYIFH